MFVTKYKVIMIALSRFSYISPCQFFFAATVLSRPVAQNIVLQPHLLEWFFLSWTLTGMKMAGYPLFSDPVCTPQESNKMQQNGTIRPKIKCSWRNWDQNLKRAFSFSFILEWNYKKCRFLQNVNIFLL